VAAGAVASVRSRARASARVRSVTSGVARSLERDGLVAREVTLEVPVRVEYSLTQLGRSLSVPLAAVRDWSAEQYCSVVAARETYDQDHADSA
jgi:DNA-binding MarR family transcriptional regulator